MTTTTIPTAAPTPVDEATAEPLLEQVRQLLTQHPDLALRFRDRVTSIVRNTEYPALVVEEITDDGETYDGMRCPWCGTDVANADELVALDENDRITTFAADDFDWERHSVTTIYDGIGQFDGLAYVHIECYRPVSLPDGWTER